MIPNDRDGHNTLDAPKKERLERRSFAIDYELFLQVFV